MDKAKALALLGGTPAKAAQIIGASRQAIEQWPDPLTSRIADRVQAALWRQSQAKKKKRP